MSEIKNIILDNLAQYDGIFALSFVNSPAVDSDFKWFEKIQFNEEKQCVTGCILRADYPILRMDKQGNPYYITFTKHVIKQIAEKYFIDDKQNLTNTNHGLDYTKDNHLVEWFIKDSEKGINPVGFENIADGSLFATYHISDETIWNGIKSGKLNGYSVEGNFKLNNNDNMVDKFQKVIDRLLHFSEVDTDKGKISIDELVTGAKVLKVLDDGSYDIADDGEYVIDNKVITVKDGKIETIDETKPEETKPEETVKLEEIKPEETVAQEEINPERIYTLEREIATLKTENEAIKSIVDELKTTVAKIASTEIQQSKVKDVPEYIIRLEEFKSMTKR